MSGETLAEAVPFGEVMRRRAALMIHIIYWLLIFEGALRKWAFPQFQQYFFFIRDPFMFAAIYYAIQGRLIQRSPLVIWLVVLVIGELFVSGFQVAIDGFNPLIAGYGLRSYFLFAALAVVVPAAFTRADTIRLIKATLLVCIPMAVLVVVQYLSSPTAWINKSYSEGPVFTVDASTVRTTGTFTFTAGMACFDIVAVAFLLIAYYEQRRKPLFPLWLFLIVAASVAACLAVSGSRTAFAQAGITMGLVLFMEAIKRPDRQRIDIMIGIVALMVGFAGFMYEFFPHALELLWARHEGATRIGENPLSRLIEMIIGVHSDDSDFSLFGEGIGSRSNAALALRTSSEPLRYVEWEVDRILTETGLITGGAYMLLRWALALYIFAAGVRSLREHDDGIPLLLWSFSGLWLLQGLLTAQGTWNCYGWLCVGLALHAIDTSSQLSAPAEPMNSANVVQGERGS